MRLQIIKNDTCNSILFIFLQIYLITYYIFGIILHLGIIILMRLQRIKLYIYPIILMLYKFMKLNIYFQSYSFNKIIIFSQICVQYTYLYCNNYYCFVYLEKLSILMKHLVLEVIYHRVKTKQIFKTFSFQGILVSLLNKSHQHAFHLIFYSQFLIFYIS